MTSNAARRRGAMTWRRLMSDRRLASGAPPGDDGRRPFEVDRDRIVFTEQWRRAAAKTQVHDPDPAVAAVRSRLTHSLEVSHVGRSLGQRVGRVVAQRHGLPARAADDIAHAVAAAGLAHDLGNPPFGHAGEWSVAGFFDTAGRGLLSGLGPVEQAEFANCDGNAQGFRIVTRLTGWRPEGGLQLTAATLGALVKYPFLAADSQKPWGRRKFGFYASEAALFGEVAEEVGLFPLGGAAGAAWCRHPLVYLLEAADDLCYLVVDVVDAALVGDLSFDEAYDLLAPLPKEIGPEYAEVPGAKRKLEYLQSKAIGRLLDDCAAAFLDAEEALLLGRPCGSLIAASPAADQMGLIASVSNQRIYNSSARVARERSGGAVLFALLEEFSEAFLERERLGRSGRSGAATLALAMPQEELAEVPTDRYGWLRAMVDVVMGMTDARAASLAVHFRPELADDFCAAFGADVRGAALPMPAAGF
jgi:dGTPase